MTAVVQPLADLLEYQSSLPTHQQLRIEWDSLPGRHEPLDKEEAKTLPLSRDFVVAEQTHSLPTGIGRPFPYIFPLLEDRLVFVAVSSKNEVRGFQLAFDPRAWHSEDFQSGKNPKRTDAIFPKATLRIVMPDDPQIGRIVVYRPKYEGKLRLEEIGAIELVDPRTKLPHKK